MSSGGRQDGEAAAEKGANSPVSFNALYLCLCGGRSPCQEHGPAFLCLWLCLTVTSVLLGLCGLLFCTSSSNKHHMDPTNEVPGQLPGVWVPCPHSQAAEKPETRQALATGWFGWEPLGLDGDLGKPSFGGRGQNWTPWGLWPSPSPSDRRGWENIRKSWCHGLSPCIFLPAPPHPAPDVDGLLQIKSSHLHLQKESPCCPPGDHRHCMSSRAPGGIGGTAQ